MQKFDKALENQKKVLEILLQILGNNHPKIADCYHELGLTFIQLEKYPEALHYTTATLNIQKQLYNDADHPQILATLKSLAKILHHLN